MKVEHRWSKVAAAGKRADFRNLGHAGAIIRKVAGGSIRLGKTPSAAGSPPHTKGKSRNFKKGILYAVERVYGTDVLVIGTSASILGDSGKAHELGGIFRGHVYQKRPFMVPALDKVRSQIPAEWAGTYTEN